MNISPQARQDIEAFSKQFAGAIQQRILQENDPNRQIGEAVGKRNQMRAAMAFELFKIQWQGDPIADIAGAVEHSFDAAEELLAQADKRDNEDNAALVKRMAQAAQKPPLKAVGNESADSST